MHNESQAIQEGPGACGALTVLGLLLLVILFIQCSPQSRLWDKDLDALSLFRRQAPETTAAEVGNWRQRWGGSQFWVSVSSYHGGEVVLPSTEDLLALCVGKATIVPRA